MSEYPWDMENMMLAQHDQPCDCAICDDIHMARIMRRKRRKEAEDKNEWEDAYERTKDLLDSKEVHCNEVEAINKVLAERIEQLNVTLEKTKVSLHVAESKCTDKWVQTGLLAEQKRNDLLYDSWCSMVQKHNEQVATTTKWIEETKKLQAENAELRGINQSLSVDWVKHKDMQSALEFFSRLKQDMLIVDINMIANKALGI